MPIFSYIATDRAGETVEGTVEARDSAIAFGKVRALGYEVQRIRAASEKTVAIERPSRSGVARRLAENLVFPAVSGIPLIALATFYRQLATLINAGLPMYQALVTVGNQTRNAQLRRIIAEFQDAVQAGGRLTDVMERRRWAFSEIQIEMLRAAEQGGALDTMLHRIADYLDQEVAMRRLISRLTLYPKLLLVVAVLILGPTAFLSGGTPAISRLVLGSMGVGAYSAIDYVIDTVLTPILYVAAVYLVFAVGRVTLFQSENAALAWERIKRAIPGIGTVSRQFALARFGRAFAAMYAGGLPLPAGSRIAGNASGSRIVAQATAHASAAAERGVPLSQSLRETGAFPEMVLGMIATGEQTGNVDTMMQKAAEYLENEGEERAHRYAHLFSMAVYLLVLLLIAASVLSFWIGYGGRAVGG